MKLKKFIKFILLIYLFDKNINILYCADAYSNWVKLENSGDLYVWDEKSIMNAKIDGFKKTIKDPKNFELIDEIINAVKQDKSLNTSYWNELYLIIKKEVQEERECTEKKAFLILLKTIIVNKLKTLIPKFTALSNSEIEKILNEQEQKSKRVS